VLLVPVPLCALQSRYRRQRRSAHVRLYDPLRPLAIEHPGADAISIAPAPASGGLT
jgi:hypothetical protein